MASKTLVFGCESDVLLSLMSRATPTDEEFRAYASFAVEKVRKGGLRGSLVLTEGAAPTARQRAMIVESMDGLAVPTTAVVSSSPLLRGVATALSWMRGDASIRVFRPDDLHDALRFVGLRESEFPRVEKALEALARKFVGGHRALA